MRKVSEGPLSIIIEGNFHNRDCVSTILIFILASVQVEEVQGSVKTSDESVEGSRSADVSVAALKRSSECCEKGKIPIKSK